MRGRCLLVVGLGSLALAGAANAASGKLDLATPELQAAPPLATALAPIRDRVIRGRAPRVLAEDEWWGGPITNSRGEAFKIFVSRAFAVDEAARAQWANFLGWALHGKEIRELTVYQVPLAQIPRSCGGSDGTLACYYPTGEKLFFPGDRGPAGTLSISEILLHEYGHHIAFNRETEPWHAVVTGPKYWSSFENVCKRASRNQLFPGDEGRRYLLNPGEGFAEVYRVLNVERAQSSNAPWYQTWGQPLPWQFTAFSHDAAALKEAQKDVLQPWTKNRTIRWSGRPGRQSIIDKARGEFSATRRVITPLDGQITATIDSAPKGSYVEVKSGFFGSTGRRRAKTNICGETSYQVSVKTLKRAPFKVTITLP
jgi:hypothetical protein